MMTIKILVWNAQHLDNQKDAISDAYKEKVEFINNVLLQIKPCIVAFLETGKNGNLNDTLKTDLSADYVLVTWTGVEDGDSPTNTLGTMVFVRKGLEKEFVRYEKDWVMGGGEKRAPCFVQRTSTKEIFAFYHANASGNAWSHINSAYSFFVQLLEKEEKLVFFGGDLNDGVPMAKITATLPLHASEEAKKNKELVLLMPTGSHTHASIRKSTSVADAYTVTLRFLDFAFVADKSKWTARCDGSLGHLSDSGASSTAATSQSSSMPPVYTRANTLETVVDPANTQSAPVAASSTHNTRRPSVTHAAPAVDQTTIKRYKPEPVRLYMNMKMRSDHYPVLYEYS